jgi:hypothetical protein
MPEVKKHTIHHNRKRSNIKKLLAKEVVFITKTEVPASKTLFPEKLKKVNKLLEKTTFLHE